MNMHGFWPLVIAMILPHVSVAAGNALRFGSEIVTLTNEILGGSAFKSHLKEGEKFHIDKLEPNSMVQKLAQNIENKIRARDKAIKRLRDAVIKSYRRTHWGQYTECCRYSDYDLNLVYDYRFLGRVDVNALCIMRSSLATKTHEVPDDEFLRAAEENLAEFPGIKAQYFGSDGGTLLSFPASSVPNCASYDNRFRPWYVQASAPVPKDVVLVLDMSGSMAEQNRIHAAIHAATTILDTLSPDDRVAVIGFSDHAYAVGSVYTEKAISHKHYPGSRNAAKRKFSCYDTTMVAATPRNLHHLASAVKKMVPHGGTNYTTGLTMAFDFLYDALKHDVSTSCVKGEVTPTKIAYSRHRTVIFLSDGKPSDLPISILRLIYNRNREMHNSVVLLCYALGEGTFGHFVQKMAQQYYVPENAGRCDTETSECAASGADLCNLPTPRSGLYRQVVDSKFLRSEMGSYYNYFATTSSDQSSEVPEETVWSVPYFDAGGLGMVVTAASPIIFDGRLIGVVGTDLTMREMMAEVEYFHAGGQASYAFLLDDTGRVLLHPYIPSPSAVTDDPVLTDIGAFERTPEVKEFLRDILSRNSAENDPSAELTIHRKTVTTKRVLPQEHRNVEARDAVLTYSCSRVRHLLVCVVVEGDVVTHLEFTPQSVPDDFNFLYHRFDITQPPHICQYQDSVSSGGRAAIFFAPSAFLDVGKHLGQPETTLWIAQLGKYVADGVDYYTGSARHEQAAAFNLKPGIRDAVRVTARLEKIWNAQMPGFAQMNDERNEWRESLRRNVIHRYFSSENGVFSIHPGVKMPKSYNPSHRPWYGQARSLLLQQMASGKNCGSGACADVTALSPPYLDASGAGVVVTISQAIVAPRMLGSDESEPLHIVGVMGGDMKLAFLEAILLQTATECDADHECILMDLAGYVIYDNTLGGLDEETIEHIVATSYHITFAHKMVADVLVREEMLVRQKCTDVSKVAFLEEFRVDLERLEDGAGDLPFEIAHVNSTNTILLVIPSDFWLPQFVHQKDCIEHDLASATCVRRGDSDQCESPCVNTHEGKRQYDVCRNTFHFSWEHHPPPCVPDKFVDEQLGVVVDDDGGFGGVVASTLKPCFVYDVEDGEISVTSPKMTTSSVPWGLAVAYAIMTVLLKLWSDWNR